MVKAFIGFTQNLKQFESAATALADVKPPLQP
jgi:hypothetical protein